MRSVSVRLCDMEKVTIPLGFVGENIFTKVYIDCKKIFDEHPDAVPTLAVVPPQGDAYPAVVTKEGDMVIWEITASDLIYKGSGEMQLAFVEDEMIGKTWTAKTKIYRSIEPSGEVPDPIANWLTQANATLLLVNEAIELIPQTIDEKLQDFIDDTAGDGDTTKVWSADKTAEEVSDLKNVFEQYGALNRVPVENGTFTSGSLTIVAYNCEYTISGNPTGTGETHFNIFSNTSALPEGIKPGSDLEVTQSCDNSNIIFRLYNRVSGSNVLLCEIPGTGRKYVKVDANATGMIVRISAKNGQSYSSVVTKVGVFGSLTKQSTQEQIDNIKQTQQNDETKISEMRSYLPTAGDKQLVNPDTVSLINARVTVTESKLIADNAYISIIVPVSVASGKKYWAKIFSNSVSLDDMRLFTFNSVELNSVAVNNPDSISPSLLYSSVSTNATASYLLLMLKITSGTIDDILNNLVISKSASAPEEYVSYFIPVDEAIENAVGVVTSPDCIEVGTSASDYEYTNVNTAVTGNPTSIIKINYGTYETEVENLATDKKLIGTDVDLCILEKTDGDYDHPPIEIACGMIKNLTVKMKNDSDAQHFGYCVHSDNSATANKKLIISNCKFDNDLYRAIGMGVRGGSEIVFENCEFVGHAETTGQSVYIHNSDGDTASVRFINCYFKANKECMCLQGWGSSCSINWEFINCTCVSETYGTGIETVWTDYVSGSTHDQSRLHEFSGKFTLLPTSHGNNISILNYSA